MLVSIAFWPAFLAVEVFNPRLCFLCFNLALKILSLEDVSRKYFFKFFSVVNVIKTNADFMSNFQEMLATRPLCQQALVHPVHLPKQLLKLS